MKHKMKIVAGLALVFSVILVAFLALPIQANVDEANNVDSIQSQDKDRLKNRDCECDHRLLRKKNQTRDRLRIQDFECLCDCDQEQSRVRERNQECVRNGTCDCSTDMQQSRYQYRKGR